MKTGDKSFTLIEMLVVIVIISVLAALLLPAIGTVKDRARTVTCAHNEKRIGEAFGSYLNDNQGFYPYIYPSCVSDTNNHTLGGCALGVGYVSSGGSAGGGCSKMYSWNFSIAQYFGISQASLITWVNNNLCVDAGWNGYCSSCSMQSMQPVQDCTAYNSWMQCPSNPWRFPGQLTPSDCSWNYASQVVDAHGQKTSTWRLYPTTYAMNGDGFPISFCGDNINAVTCDCKNPNNFNKCVNLSDINHPSSLALIGEMPWDMWTVASSSPANVFFTQATSCLPSGNGTKFYLTADGVGGTNTTVDFKWTNVTRFAYCNGYVAAWHGMRMNTLFTDGHVEQISQSMLMSNAVQFQTGTDTTAPGWLFFNDGKAKNWYANQFPGYNFPQTTQ